MPTLTEPPIAPPDIVEHDGGGDRGWVELTTARNDIDAHLLTGRLAQLGIETRRVRDRSNQAWLYGGANPWGPVTVLVPRYQFEDARIALAELSFAAPAVEPPVARSTSRRQVVVFWSIAIILGTALSVIGLMRSADYLQYLEGCASSQGCGP